MNGRDITDVQEMYLAAGFPHILSQV
jgi:hypothetical protein